MKKNTEIWALNKNYWKNTDDYCSKKHLKNQVWKDMEAEKRKIELKVTPEVLDKIGELGYDPVFGARPLKRVIQRLIQDPLAMDILSGKFKEGSKISMKINEKGNIEF